MKAKEGEFDRFAPENVAAVAAWLASDLCNGINGQVVKVMAGSWQLLEGWRPLTEATSEKPWTIDFRRRSSHRVVRQVRRHDPAVLLSSPA